MRRLIYRLCLWLAGIWTLITAAVIVWAMATLPGDVISLGFDQRVMTDALATSLALNLAIWAAIALPLLLIGLLVRPRRHDDPAIDRREPHF